MVDNAEVHDRVRIDRDNLYTSPEAYAEQHMPLDAYALAGEIIREVGGVSWDTDEQAAEVIEDAYSMVLAADLTGAQDFIGAYRLDLTGETVSDFDYQKRLEQLNRKYGESHPRTPTFRNLVGRFRRLTELNSSILPSSGQEKPPKGKQHAYSFGYRLAKLIRDKGSAKLSDGGE
ncbi:hypothetical protein ACFLZ1_04355 [Patescibacteria group bacterium]